MASTEPAQGLTEQDTAQIHKALSQEKNNSNSNSNSSKTASLDNEPSATAATPKREGGKHVTTKDATRHSFNEKRDPDEEKIELTEDDPGVYEQLGFSFPTWKKWTVLTVIFLVQVSMNLNTSLYSNGLEGISAEFNVSAQAARVGAAIYLITYAFGCELWAPWSEELGRRPILQLSLFLVNLWQLPVALAPNFGSLIVGRALGGISSAGGSVTLGMIADMWEPDVQQYAVAFVVFSSVGGSIVGPVMGGAIYQNFGTYFPNAGPGSYAAPWRWCMWFQLIIGVVVQLMHFFLVPETRTTIMLDNIAKKRRAKGENVWGPNELVPYKDRFSAKEILITWIRPFKMFLTEPIVLTLSLLSGFSDALIFMFIQSFSLVYTQWGFDTTQQGLVFFGIGVGYLLAYLSFIPAIRKNIAERRDNPDDERAQYESRLSWLLWTAPCLPLGLIGFAWTSSGNALVSNPNGWVPSVVFSAIVGIANYSIYMATIDYMICAYGPYSASATGGNGWSRDFLAGVLTIPATPFFENIGGEKHLQYASTILFCISFVLVIAVYVIYWKGPVLRKRSPFAQHLALERKKEKTEGHHTGAESIRRPMGSRRSSQARLEQDQRGRPNIASRQGSRANTPSASRRASMDD